MPVSCHQPQRITTGVGQSLSLISPEQPFPLGGMEVTLKFTLILFNPGKPVLKGHIRFENKTYRKVRKNPYKWTEEEGVDILGQ